MHEPVTLMPPDSRDPTAGAVSSGFPDDLLRQSAERLRVLALLYAVVFFLAGIFPPLLLPSDRARFLGSFVQWGPGVIGTSGALAATRASCTDAPIGPYRSADPQGTR